MNRFTLLVFFVFQMLFVAGQKRDSTVVKRVSNNIIPIAFYLPETGFALGGTGILTWRFKNESINSRPSQLLYSAAYTFKNQLLIFLPYDVYLKDEKWRIKGELGYYRYFYNFYGIGPNTKITDKETYSVNFPRFEALLYRQLKGNHFLGVGYRFDNFDIVKLAEEGILDSEEIIGKSGGNISNLKLAYLFDNRDHIFDTRKGIYIEASLEKGMRSLGADYKYVKSEVNVRLYHRILNRITFAHQLYSAHVSNDSPFFVYPYVSTPQYSRGFADRRFVDRTLVNLQSEARFNIRNRFGGVVFMSIANLGSEYSALAIDESKVSAGVGLRYVLNKQEKTKIRLDVGLTNEGMNFYITANDAF